MRRSELRILVAAVGLVIAAVVAGCGDVSTAPPIGEPSTPQSPASDLIVHDGDTVEVTGQVIAAPGQPVVFCPPRATADDPQVPVVRPGETPTPVEPPAPTCPAALAVTVSGVDLHRLSHPETAQGTRTGWATLRGVWHNRSIDVTEQTAPKQPTPRPDDVPCPAPTAGWKSNNANTIREQNALVVYIRARPERFADVRIGYPVTTGKVSVMVVPVVTGDLNSTQRELEAVYKANLCVTRGVLSIAEADRLSQRVAALMSDTTSSISGIALDTPHGRVVVALFIVTEQLHEQFATIGLDKLHLAPVVRPVQ